jgi:hypothetical protein
LVGWLVGRLFIEAIIDPRPKQFEYSQNSHPHPRSSTLILSSRLFGIYITMSVAQFMLLYVYLSNKIYIIIQNVDEDFSEFISVSVRET